MTLSTIVPNNMELESELLPRLGHLVVHVSSRFSMNWTKTCLARPRPNNDYRTIEIDKVHGTSFSLLDY